MFANNDVISERQCFRMLCFDYVGIGTLLLPGYLGKNCGGFGILIILLGMVLGVWYAGLLHRHGRLGNGIIFRLLLGVYFFCICSLVLYFFGELIKTELLKDASYELIVVTIFLLAIYGMYSGLEARCRIFEVLFWLVLLPFFLLLCLGGKGFSHELVLLDWQMELARVTKGIGAMILLFSYMICTLFLYEQQNQPTTKINYEKSVKKAVVVSGGLLVFNYIILCAVLGVPCFQTLDKPTVTLLSNVRIPGGFLHRHDAFLIGVWFFTLYPMICSSLFYCYKSLHKGQHTSLKQDCMKNKITFFLLAGIVMLSSFACQWKEEWKNSLEYSLCIVLPFLLILPFFSKNKKSGFWKKKLSCTGILMLGILLQGCSVTELENRSFPLAMGIGLEENKCVLYYQYQDLSQMSSKEGANKGYAKQRVIASDLEKAIHKGNAQNGKVIDTNHLKVCVIEKSFLNDEQQWLRFLDCVKQEEELSWNTLCFLTEDMEALLALQKELQMPIGTYLEEMVEKNPDFKQEAFLTAGKLYQNHCLQQNNCLLPVLEKKGNLPVIRGFSYLSGEEITLKQAKTILNEKK